MIKCSFCGKENEYTNFCNNNVCHIEYCRSQGGKEYLPNGLPIKCITADGLMLEHEHGNHKDYKFPLKVEYIGPVNWDEANEDLPIFGFEVNEKNYCKFKSESHALIYTDGSVALTMFECNYAQFSVRTGKMIGGSLGHWNDFGKFNSEKLYKLSTESHQKLIEYAINIKTELEFDDV